MAKRTSKISAIVEYANTHKDRTSKIAAQVEYSGVHKDRTSKIVVMVEYQIIVRGSVPAYLSGYEPASDIPAFVSGSNSSTGSTTAYVNGQEFQSSSQSGYLNGSAGSQDISEGHSAFVHGQSDVTLASQNGYVNGGAGVLSQQPAFLEGWLPTSSVHAMIVSYLVVKSSQKAYLKGGNEKIHVYLRGGANVKSSVRAFLSSNFYRAKTSAYIKANVAKKSYQKAFLSSNFLFVKQSAFIRGGVIETSHAHAFLFDQYVWATKSAYLYGIRLRTSFRHAYIPGPDANTIRSYFNAFVEGFDPSSTNVKSDVPAYINSIVVEKSSTSGYTKGGSASTVSTASFAFGNLYVLSSTKAYIKGPSGLALSIKHGYCIGKIKNSTHAYVAVREGDDPMAAVNYIYLQTSDGGATKSKKFRVLAQDYDDGTPEKAENIEKTIGGGIDHSVGAVYTTWSPIIRVRHTESETDFGNTADLEYFYGLNSPNAVPSNDINFVDHHQVSHTIHIIGKMSKNLMGCAIEGSEAWYLYRIQLIEVG